MDDLHHYRIIVPWPGCKDTGDWVPMAASGDLAGIKTRHSRCLCNGRWMRCWDVLSAIHHRGIRMCIHVHIYIYIRLPRHGLLMWSAVSVLSCILLSFVLTVLMFWGRVLPAFLGSVVGSQHASGMRVIHDSSTLYIVASAI